MMRQYTEEELVLMRDHLSMVAPEGLFITDLTSSDYNGDALLSGKFSYSGKEKYFSLIYDPSDVFKKDGLHIFRDYIIKQLANEMRFNP